MASFPEYADDFTEFIRSSNIEFNTERYIAEQGRGRRIKILVDPSALSFITVLRRRLYRIQHTINDVLPGIKLTATLFKQGRLMISDQCKNTIREVGLYAWDKDAQKKGEDKPLKQHDHAMDPLRYFANSFEKGGLKAGRSLKK